MSLIENIGSAVTGQFKALARDVRSMDTFAGYGYGSNNPVNFLFNGGDLEEGEVISGSHGNSIVDICLSYIARQFGLATWVIEQLQGDKWKGIGDHPAISLLRVPNDHYDGEALFSTTAASLALGNAYWILCRDQGGTVREIWWAPQLWDQNSMFGCTPHSEVGYNNNLPFCYEYRAGGMVDYLPIEDVIHFRNPIGEHNNPFIGKNPLRAQHRHIGADNVIADYTYHIAANYGVMGALLINKSEKEIGPDAAQGLKEKWRERTTGKNRGMPLISPHNFDVVFPDNSPEKMAIDKLNDTPEERIPAALGLNAMAVQLGAGLARSTFSNSEQASKAAFDGGIAPLHKIVATAITNKLLPQVKSPVKTVRLAFDYSSIPALQEDVNALRASATSMWQSGAITLGTFNELLKLPAPPRGQENLRFFDLQAMSQPSAPTLKEGQSFLDHSVGLKRTAPTREERRRWLEDAQAILEEAGTTADREALVKVAQSRMLNAAEKLRQGDSSIAKWSTQMETEVVNAHTAQAALGYRLPQGAEMPEHVLEWLGEKISFHQEALAGFIKDVNDGRYDFINDDGVLEGYTDALVSRTSQYANATRATYENAGLLRGKDDGHKSARRVMAAVEHCADCEAAAALGWVPLNECPEIGDSTCKANCSCVILTSADSED